jgi:hypothetical protein
VEAGGFLGALSSLLLPTACRAGSCGSSSLTPSRATATSLSALAHTWKDSDGSARQILLAQKLAPLLETLLGPVGQAPGGAGRLRWKELEEAGSPPDPLFLLALSEGFAASSVGTPPSAVCLARRF